MDSCASHPGAGRPRGPLVLGPSHPGQLVDPAGPQARVPIMPESWSPPWAIGPKRDSPRRAGGNCGNSDMVPSCPGQLVDTAGPWHSPESPGRAPRTRGPPGMDQVAPESWSKPRAIRPEYVSPGTAGRNREPLDMGPSGPREWSTTQSLGPGQESPGTAGRPQGPSDTTA